MFPHLLFSFFHIQSLSLSIISILSLPPPSFPSSLPLPRFLSLSLFYFYYLSLLPTSLPLLLFFKPNIFRPKVRPHDTLSRPISTTARLFSRLNPAFVDAFHFHSRNASLSCGFQMVYLCMLGD